MMTTTFPWPMPTWMWTMLLDLITCDFDQGCYGYLVLWKLMTWVDIASPSLLAMDSPMRGAARTEIVCKTTAAGQRCSKRFLADFCCCPIVPPFHLSKKIKKAHQILKKKHTHIIATTVTTFFFFFRPISGATMQGNWSWVFSIGVAWVADAWVSWPKPSNRLLKVGRGNWNGTWYMVLIVYIYCIYEIYIYSVLHGWFFSNWSKLFFFFRMMLKIVVKYTSENCHFWCELIHQSRSSRSPAQFFTCF